MSTVHRTVRTRVRRLGLRVLRAVRLEDAVRARLRLESRRAGAAAAVRVTSADARLLRSGLFDAEFYAVCAGREFANPKAAARHYVRWGCRHSLPPHPLVSVALLPSSVRGAMQRGDVDALLNQLMSPAGLDRPWSPLFDPRLLPGAAERTITPDDDGGALERVRAFLAGLGPESLLTLPPETARDQVPWGEVRPRLESAAAAVAVHRRLLGKRTRDRWNENAEEQWLAEVATLPPVTGAPAVSIVMPVWNRADRVLTAIRSVQEQDTDAWELIVVDDGSTDDTVAVLEAAAAADPRIRVVPRPHGGVCAARNAGLDAVRGEYVAFLDSDNTWRPHFLSTMLRVMRRDGLAAAYAASKLTSTDGSVRYRAFAGGLAHLLVVNHIDMNVLVVSAEVARGTGGFDTSLVRWVDHDFAIKVARQHEPTLLPFIGCDYDDADDDPFRITSTQSEHWQWLPLGNAYVEWDRLERELDERVAGRVSIVMPVYQDVRMTLDALRAVAQARGDDDVEVVVIDNGGNPPTALGLAAVVAPYPWAKLVRVPRNLNFAIGSNLGVAHSTGEHILFLNNDTKVRENWLAPLRARLEDPRVLGVQPALFYADDTIQAAGTVFPTWESLPVHLLAGHPHEDALKVATLEFSAVTAAAVLMRASQVVALRGFDPIFVNGSEDIDLCLRARDRFGGHFAVEPGSEIDHLESKTPGRRAAVSENRRIFLDRWRGRLPGPELHLFQAVGLDVAGIGLDTQPYAAPKPVVVRLPREVGSEQRLRWNIKIASTPGPRGLAWGDTHFAAAFADALRGEGQEVVTSRHGAHDTPAHVFDDVNFHLRGIDVARPQPGKINVMWVISHPDAVTRDEASGFDLVYAASESWAREMSAKWGRPLLPLLQATQTSRFFVDPAAERTDQVVFVGQARRYDPRRIVMDAIAAGLDPRVWGPRWDQHVEPARIGGAYLPNEALGDMYRTAGIVLNDHWDDMAARGFVSNRLFDAVACGARVVSDPVHGLEELFEGAVVSYTDPEELREITAVSFPDDDERARIAAKVREQHSFESRAHRIVQDVLALHAQRGA